jgi:hypothetical protein
MCETLKLTEKSNFIPAGINFSNMTNGKIVEGIKKLGDVIKDQIKLS